MHRIVNIIDNSILIDGYVIGAQVVVFPFADVQRQLIASYDSMGFVNAGSGCTSDLAITQYSTGNLYSLGNPTFTSEGAKVRNTRWQHPYACSWVSQCLRMQTCMDTWPMQAGMHV